MTHHYPRIESASPERDGSTPAHLRKSNKPLLEKKRRARINRSLEQLKSLVLDALKKDTARYSKLEKADILEMTVKHLRHIQRQQMTVAMTFDPSVVSKYNVGYQECAHEVDRYLGTIDGLSPEVRMRLMHHLGNSYNCANDAAMTSSFQYRAAAAAALSLPFPLPSATAESSLPGSCLRSALPAQLCNMVDLSRAMAAEFRRSPSLAEDLSARPASAGSGSGSDCKNNDMNLDSINNNNADAVDLNRRDCKPFCDKGENSNVELNRHKSSKVTGHSSPGGHSPLSPLGVVKQEQVWRPW